MKAPKDFDLKGSVAFVTGGCGLLGTEMGKALAESGATVFLCDIDPVKAKKTLASFPSSIKSRVFFQYLDVTSEESIHSALGAVIKKKKRLDIVVNAAIASGTIHFNKLENYDMNHWNRVMEANVNGTFLVSRASAAIMIRKKIKGSIINFGSIYGVVGADQRIYGKSGINSPAVYAASKGAIISLTRYLAVYWADKGIRVNSISPGGVFNQQAPEFIEKYSARTPLGRMMERNEIRGVTLFLASKASSFVTGQNLLVDGGWTAW